MVVNATGRRAKATIMRRAERYERLAIRARQNPTLVLLGYTVAGLFMVLGIMDCLSTNWAISVGAYEINWIMRTAMEYLGTFWILPKLAFQALVATMIVWSPNRATIGIMTVMCAWLSSVVTNNFIIAYALSTVA